MEDVIEVERVEPAPARRRTEAGSLSCSHINRADTTGIRDELASIGEEIKVLQHQLSNNLSPEATVSEAVTQALWRLLWRLRPFLFLASPSTEHQWRVGGALFDAYHRRHYVKDAAHVATVLRLYLVLLRFTVVCPAAALHGCLTLFSVLAVLNDPRLRSWKDTSDRLLEGFIFVARTLHSSENDVFAQLLNVSFELLSEVTAYFDNPAQPADSALFLRLSVQPSAALFAQSKGFLGSIVSSHSEPDAGSSAQLLQEMFSTITCVETHYEARCIQACLLRLVVRLSEQRLLLSPSPDRVGLVCDVACHLVSCAVPGDEGVLLNPAHHHAAWDTLHHFAVVNRRLLAHTQGPLILSILAEQWGRQNPQTCSSIFEVTVAEKALFDWCRCLSPTELDSLVLAAHHRGGAGLDGQGAMMECLVQMWNVAVQWCKELFASPDSTGDDDALRGVDGARHIVPALRMLREWVRLSERVFRSTVLRTSALAELTSLGEQQLLAAYNHNLQLLASELPLASITASLLCAQLPRSVVPPELAFLPTRILSFFDVPSLPTCIARVVNHAKNCLDVSAYRLLEANALAVQACLKVSSLSLRHDAAAFQKALAETLQVVQHHESPSYSVLVQAIIVLVHAFPTDPTQGGLHKPEAVIHVVQELDNCVSSRHDGRYSALGVAAPLWHMLNREAAAILFRAGSGLGWSRRVLMLQPEALTSANAAEIFLCRAAGLAEAAQHALAETILPESTWTSPSKVRSPISSLSPGLAADSEEAPIQQRRAYDSITSVFPVVMQLFHALTSLFMSLHSDAQWRGYVAPAKDGVCATSNGATVAMKKLLDTAANICVLLLEAKYRFAAIAAPSVDNEQHIILTGATAVIPRSSALKEQLAQPAMVVDVDDEDSVDDEAEGNDQMERPGRQRKAAPGKAMRSLETAEATTKTTVGGTPRDSSLWQYWGSKFQQLEKIVEINRSKLLPLVLALARCCDSKEKGRDAACEAEEVLHEDADVDHRPASSGRIEPWALRCAVVRLAHACLALSPPDSAKSVKELFKLDSLNPGNSTDSVCYCALREIMLQSKQWTDRRGEVDDASNRALRLTRLSGMEWLLTAVVSSMRDGSPAQTAKSSKRVVELLWFGRRFFQGIRRPQAAANDVLDNEEHVSLTERSVGAQEHCMAASPQITEEGVAWLCLCFDFYTVYEGGSSTDKDTALAIMGLCIETARGVMALFEWSATDLLRFRERPFVFSSFIKGIVDKEDRDLTVVLTSSLDMLGRYLVSADQDKVVDGTGALAAAAAPLLVHSDHATQVKLKHLMVQEKVADWRVAAGALAYVLYECGTRPVAKQMHYFEEVMNHIKKDVKDVPAMVRSTIHFIAFHIMSLEADAQMLTLDRRLHTRRDSQRHLGESTALQTHSSVLAGAPSGLLDSAKYEGREDESVGAGKEGGSSSPQSTITSELRVNETDGDGASVTKDVLDSIAFSDFERALQQLVTLSEAAESVAGVERSLRKPVVRAVAAEVLRKHMFAVLDAVHKAIRIEPAVAYRNDGANAAEVEEASLAPPGSRRTRRRWLLGLASFIRFMGPQTTPIALMLPTLLGHCARFPSLLSSVCIVWRELVVACTDEYLTESAASIVLSLVSLEQNAALDAESKRLLLSALRHLYTRTGTASFWDSYKVVLGTFSELIRITLHSRHPLASESVEGSRERHGSNAQALLLGFASVMRSGSLQSTTVFLRALYQYLRAADEETRFHLSHAAADHPEVLHTLLRCSEADSESALYAMRCVSLLGAVSASGASGMSDTQLTTKGADDGGTTSMTPSPVFAHTAWNRMTWTQSFYLDAETVLNWRKFSFALLQHYFPHVFASTADPVLHNCIAFAVQELIRASTRQERLQHKGVELRREDVVHLDELGRYTWWARLTPHVKQLLGGFTTTRYALTVNWQTRLRTPEYTASLGYRRWLFAFFNHLVMSCEGLFAEMVQPLRNVAKKNASLVLYLLPYLVVHILESGKAESVEYIKHEVKAVLEAATGEVNDPILSLRSQRIYEVSPESSSQEEPREHVHTVLSLLEDVEQLRWTLLRNRGRIACVFEPQDYAGSLCTRLADAYADFLCDIPWSLRCHAALRTGSHIRALRSVESQRRIPGLASVVSAVPLQRIFAALNDRESARTIHRTSPGLSPEDTAFSFENNGDWLSALGCSELVLQHRPDSGQHQLTALHCMNELGELYMISRYAASLLASPSSVDGEVRVSGATEELGGVALKGNSTFSQLVSEAPQRTATASGVSQLRHHVQAYANEAAWRLGQWEMLLPSCTSPTSLPPSMDPRLPTLGSDGPPFVSLAMPAAYLHRALSGTASLATVCRVTDSERAKVVPLFRTPCLEDLTAQSYKPTLILHALGDVDAVCEMCARAFVPEGTERDCRAGSWCHSQSSSPMMKLPAHMLPSSVKENIATMLSRRESYVEDTIEAREPLLALHRLIYRELGMQQKVAETWLKQSELLHNSGLGEAALTAARQAAYESREHVTETSYYVLVANLLHDTQSPTPAIEFARECVANVRIPATTRAKLQVLLTNWLIETGSERPERIFAEYDKACELDSRSEVVHHQMALFYDHLHTLASNASEGAAAQLTAATTSLEPSGTAKGSTENMLNAARKHQEEMVDSIGKWATRAVVHFGEALLRGVEKASVSLPRMLTLWLDSTVFLGSLLNTTAEKPEGPASAALAEMNNHICAFMLASGRPVIPPAVVMMALPQLLSRLGHPVAAVRTVLTGIVLNLMSHFPQQCLWLVLPMALSKAGSKVVVETQIIKPFADNPQNERVLRQAKIICDTLLTICSCPANTFSGDKGLSQLTPVQKINPMLAEAKFIVPVLSNFTPDIRATVSGNVFPTSPYFDRFDDRVVVMRSLQKPRRIWVHTNEGREISFLCKAKDEPRKDIRMMELAALMNSFFLSDPEAKRKRFSLRRYSITALSDDCAVIEWLNDTTPLATVAMECYALDRSGVHFSSVKKWVALVNEKKMSKMDLFTKYILPGAPPVMHQWLDRTFASNQSWYEARTLFTQSTALWSIAGHIVGLGDRHAENLMIDTVRGELMHVDFACMFDKGEKLEVPEQVRFRLTQNLTDVMGVLGPYGPFQATCEVALSCEMKNKSAVMSIVETLLHEPLIEWRQSSRGNPSKGPRQLMERVARRLDGFLDLYSVPPQRDTLSLNVESQVAKLIHHSSDLNNLSQMYIWWMAWI
ncbi:hypothetical protein JKF63_02508 [Porcisia hertigi]|uniref:Serine/threonine-protein kinase ATR n=1 Tax=Porcisia hertigi TaxID=2761500 RepID=A0A836L3V6_9TRYP|nr:hypothetical protein JKF63_02508 [Porcisia hertigi]